MSAAGMAPSVFTAVCFLSVVIAVSCGRPLLFTSRPEVRFSGVFSSNRFRLSDGFKSGEIVRLNSVQRRSRGCQARFRPSPASSVRLRLRSRGAFARPAFVRGGFPPPEVPGSFSRSRLLFRFVAVQLVHGRYLDGLL